MTFFTHLLSAKLDQFYPMLDGNMTRLLERYFGVEHLVDFRYHTYLMELATRFVDMDNSKAINWDILDF